jgi:hypothetical protein
MRWFTAIGGVIATVAALLVLQALSATQPEETAAETTPLPPPVAVILEELAAPTGASSALETLPGLSPSVAEALSEAGYSGFATDESIEGSLSREIVQTLIANGAVLVIAEKDQAVQNGAG